MASISLNSAQQNSASISYDGGTGWTIPSNGTESAVDWGSWGAGELEQERTGKTTQISYTDADGCTTTWKWTFTGCTGSADQKSGTTTVTGLVAGKSNSITATLSVTRSSKIITRTYKQKHTRTKKEDGTYTSWVEGSKTLVSTTKADGVGTNLGSQTSNTLIIYTKPTEFTWTISSSGYIVDYISATKWNELCDQVGKYLSYKNKSNQYSAANGAKVSSGAWISAAIYNQLANLLNKSTVVAGQTLITAAHFTTLRDAVNAS